MNYKEVEAARTTITRNVIDIDSKTGNIYESIAIIAKRSNQIALEMKEELNGKLAEFATTTDNLDEVFENREQIEISKFYESLPKSNAIAMSEFMNDATYYRNPKDDADAEA
jgi:DNA-directed RNA polymerase subunit K/omega